LTSPGCGAILEMMRNRVIRRAKRSREDRISRRINEAFGERLQRVRQARNIKQIAFAEALGVSRTTASNIECGRQRVFLDQVYFAAAALGVAIDELLPPMHLVAGDEVVVRSAADDPLSAAAQRAVEAVVRELSGSAPKSARERT